jgi:hypothetical protein
LTGAASTSGVCNVIDVRDATSKIARKTADLTPVLDKREHNSGFNGRRYLRVECLTKWLFYPL